MFLASLQTQSYRIMLVNPWFGKEVDAVVSVSRQCHGVIIVEEVDNSIF